MKHRTPTASSSAFTLVEITLALGVVTFGLLTTMALLPTGLDSLRNSISDTASARITEDISATLEGSDWDQTGNLASFDGQILYYDNQGNAMPTETVETALTAQLSVPANGPTLPASDTSTVSTCLRAVQIKLTCLPSAVSDRFTNLAKYKLTTLMAAKMSR